MRLGSKAKLTIGAGVIAATGFAVLGVRELGTSPSPAAAATEQQQPHVEPSARLLFAAAARPIHTGETVTPDMIRGMAADPARHPAAAVPAEAIGQVATRDIPAGALLERTSLDRAAKLAIRVPLGMRAISIDTTAEIALAGLLRPGDRVDVQVVYPGADAIAGARGVGRSQAQTLLQMVQVLAVGDAVMGTQPAGTSADASDTAAASRPAASPTPSARTVTLALFPEQVAMLSLARSTGTLSLSLRNPGDEAQPPVARVVSARPLPQTAAALVAPLPAAATMRASVRPRPHPHPIDLVVGDNHTVIYSGDEAR